MDHPVNGLMEFLILDFEGHSIIQLKSEQIQLLEMSTLADTPKNRLDRTLLN